MQRLLPLLRWFHHCHGSRETYKFLQSLADNEIDCANKFGEKPSTL